MPPSAPILYSVLADVKTSLEAIAAGADYFYTWADVRHFEDYALDVSRSSVTWPIAIIVPGRAQVLRSESVMDGTFLLVDHELELTVLGLHHDGSSRAEGRGMLAVTQMEHDIRKKMITTYTRGGYAIETVADGYEPFAEDFQKADASVAVHFKIRYRTKENDPSSSG